MPDLSGVRRTTKGPDLRAPPQHDRAVQTPDRWLDKAREPLVEAGIEPISSNMIAARADGSPATLDCCFKDSYAPLLPDASRKAVWRRLRMTVEYGGTLGEMLHADDPIPRDDIFREAATLLASAQLEDD